MRARVSIMVFYVLIELKIIFTTIFSKSENGDVFVDFFFFGSVELRKLVAEKEVGGNIGGLKDSKSTESSEAISED